MTPVLEVDGVTVRVGRAILLSDVSLRLFAGETLAIIGPNGAGKSTLMRVLSGELHPAQGQVRLKGRDLSTYAPADLAAHRATLSQHVAVGFSFTVDEIVRMGGSRYPHAEAALRARDAIEAADLASFTDRELPTLSGGEQQRAHFARVLVQLACGEARHGPGVLLLDEPTASLDLRHQFELLETARARATAGTCVAAVLHDINLAARFADRIVVLKAGRVAADGRPRDILQPDLLRDIFRIEARLDADSDGGVFVRTLGKAIDAV